MTFQALWHLAEGLVYYKYSSRKEGFLNQFVVLRE